MLEDLNMEQVEQNTQQFEQEAPSEPTQEQKQAKDAETNMARMRENMKRIERERDEAFKIAKDLEAKYTQKKQESYRIAPDDLVEGKHLNHYDSKIQELEDKVSRYEQQTHQSSAELRLKSQYTDFDKVVNSETIDALRQEYPEIASSINANSDLYSKAASAYTIIKKLGIYKEDTYKGDRDHAYANATKPRPLTSVSPQQGDSPLARANAFANGLTPELKSTLLKEMEEVRRRS